ncbi:CBL-interacting protein kinase 32 [Platanthera guangdongensis]|uniref:non-specific serine/threonine protein kinase n=1 Tax=Platanthera guangdongensis TaxID=2320717 RepID=A0ABR2MJU1_9ASPA
MGSKSKIFIVLEYATGGELFNKIQGKMGEAEARRYFHQLINAIDFCHSRGVFSMYMQIASATFTFPSWFSFGAKRLLIRILDPNPLTRITILEMLEDDWFREGYKPPVFDTKYEASLDDVRDAFRVQQEYHVMGKEEEPAALNAFELIGLSKGLNLGCLFAIEQEFKRESRFASTCSANEIITKIEETAKPLGYDIHRKNFKMMLQSIKAGRKGNLNVSTEVFQVAPSLHLVEFRKHNGDTLEFQKVFLSHCCNSCSLTNFSYHHHDHCGMSG